MNDRTGRHETRQKHVSTVAFYWQHYGLSRDPFSTIYDDKLYVSFPQWEHYIDLLHHLIKHENTLLELVGAQGSGKTTLARQLTRQISDISQVYHHTVDAQFNTEKLIDALIQGFKLKPSTHETVEEKLDACIAELQHNNKICLLILDEAHHVPVETLGALLFLLKQQSKNQMRLHIILLGNKELQTKLAHVAKQDLSGEFIHSLELEPLTLDETKEYIEQRMRRVGLEGALPLTQMQLEQIYIESQGLPDHINRLSQQTLLDNLTKQRTQQNPTFMRAHQTKIAGGLLIAATLVAASYIINKAGQYHSDGKTPVIAFADGKDSVNLPKIEKVTESNELSSQPDTAVAVSGPNRIQTAQVQPLRRHSEDLAISVVPSLGLAKDSSSLTNAQPSQPLHAARLNETAALKPTLQHIAKPQHKTAQSDIRPDAAKKRINTSQNQHLTPTEKQLLSVNGKLYTLQLIGLSRETSMEKFIKKNNLQGKADYYKVNLHGKPWFVLIYGKYPNRDAALKAIDTLPKTLRRYKPYPRSYASVQQEIKNK